MMVINDVIGLTAEEYNITHSDIIGQSREGRFVRPRHVAMYVSYIVTNWSTAEIARHFNKKDHTSVLNAIKNIEGLIKIDPGLKNKVDRLVDAIESGTSVVDTMNEKNKRRHARAIARAMSANIELAIIKIAENDPDDFMKRVERAFLMD